MGIIGNWIKKKCENKQKEEIEHFIRCVRGFDRDEQRMLAQEALQAAVKIKLNVGVSVYEPYEAMKENPRLCIILNEYIQEMKKRGMPEKNVGFMVWLHTLRCVNTIENRLLAKELWKILYEADDSTEIPEGFDYRK